ncbi:hypothetical protein ACEQ6C_40030, partial [Rhizobium ruizarguesonis]
KICGGPSGTSASMVSTVSGVAKSRSGRSSLKGSWIDGNEAEARDYFRIEDETGHRFWIYSRGFYGRELDPRWFMHGVFA